MHFDTAYTHLMFLIYIAHHNINLDTFIANECMPAPHDRAAALRLHGKNVNKYNIDIWISNYCCCNKFNR